jgi:hypothetical protein
VIVRAGILLLAVGTAVAFFAGELSGWAFLGGLTLAAVGLTLWLGPEWTDENF